MSMMESFSSRTSAVNPAGAHPASFEAWQALVAPGDVFRHPREVLAHPGLSMGERRAILASWASDASALESAPSMRCLTGSRAEPVSVDAVLSALGELDRKSAPKFKSVTSAGPPRQPRQRRLRRLADLHWYVRLGRRDDDDDPPPCPVMSMPRPKTPPDASLAAAIPA
ncbi:MULTISPECIES: hypothetical protein [Methylobacterium]|uniref:hypothetical protein n=1 Tax=Methylobacterium TaxID=407 RepID=UPI0009E93878|nr:MULTISPECIES: hypothetical protein [Methylobacterium]MCI9878855.1 hypothetical protein [Methylobacterium goesingense]